MKFKTLARENNCSVILDQTLLPHRVKYVKYFEYRQVARAIREPRVLGAPAIGIAAAYGVVLGLKRLK